MCARVRACLNLHRIKTLRITVAQHFQDRTQFSISPWQYLTAVLRLQCITFSHNSSLVCDVNQLTRRETSISVPNPKLTQGGGRGVYRTPEHDALICSGFTRTRQATYVLCNNEVCWCNHCGLSKCNKRYMFLLCV